LSISSVQFDQFAPGRTGRRGLAAVSRSWSGASTRATCPRRKKAYDEFHQSPAGDLAQANANGRLAQALDKIGKALQSGDIGQAQQALSSIRPRAQSDQPRADRQGARAYRTGRSECAGRQAQPDDLTRDRNLPPRMFVETGINRTTNMRPDLLSTVLA
jgi:hypothetical protein